jgi:hypothetical protein
LFGVSAVLLWRRVGWRRASVVYGLLMLGFVVEYIVLVEVESGGHVALLSVDAGFIAQVRELARV